MQFCFRRDPAQINRMGRLCSRSALATMPNSAVPGPGPPPPSHLHPHTPSPHLPCPRQPSGSTFPPSFLLLGAIVCNAFPLSLATGSAGIPVPELGRKPRGREGGREGSREVAAWSQAKSPRGFPPESQPERLNAKTQTALASFFLHHPPHSLYRGRRKGPQSQGMGPLVPPWTPFLHKWSKTMGGNGAQFLVQYKHGERSRKKSSVEK